MNVTVDLPQVVETGESVAIKKVFQAWCGSS